MRRGAMGYVVPLRNEVKVCTLAGLLCQGGEFMAVS